LYYSVSVSGSASVPQSVTDGDSVAFGDYG